MIVVDCALPITRGVPVVTDLDGRNEMYNHFKKFCNSFFLVETLFIYRPIIKNQLWKQISIRRM
jgi:hypothetical protein